MTHEFKPGDVIAADYPSGPVRAIVRCDGTAATQDGLNWSPSGIRDLYARPLVVLDLTPHEVMRALEALRGSRGLIAIQVADKLEAATRPPKPDEPTEFAAIAVDADGTVWHRVRDGEGDEFPWATRDSKAKWSNLRIVRTFPPFTVSAEDVTP